MRIKHFKFFIIKPLRLLLKIICKLIGFKHFIIIYGHTIDSITLSRSVDVQKIWDGGEYVGGYKK
jgi:hypothetical protein